MAQPSLKALQVQPSLKELCKNNIIAAGAVYRELIGIIIIII